MDEFLDICLLVLDLFLRPSHNVYEFISLNMEHEGYVLGGLSMMGIFLILVGLLNTFLRSSNPIFGVLVFAALTFFAGSFYAPGRLDLDAISDVLYSVVVFYIGLGFIISKISMALGILRIARWGERNFLACLLAIIGSYIVAVLISLIPHTCEWISILLLLLLCIEVFRFSKDFGVDKVIGMGLALLAGVGGIFETAIGIISMNKVFEAVVLFFRFIVPIVFCFGMLFFYVNRRFIGKANSAYLRESSGA